MRYAVERCIVQIRLFHRTSCFCQVSPSLNRQGSIVNSSAALMVARRGQLKISAVFLQMMDISDCSLSLRRRREMQMRRLPTEEAPSVGAFRLASGIV